MNEHPDPLRTAPDGEGQPVAAPPPPAASLPAHVGRYRVERLLGEGGFGRVFLARDEQLQRRVAVKVPHPHLVASPQDADAYLAEARTAAHLDHPHIVPVFDVGGTPDFPCFIVSKFIEGHTLAWAIRHDRPGPAAAAALVASVAEALQHAHQRGIVHRDIKPGNILLDTTGRTFVADFGLALREQDVGHGPRYAGTPAYMSPEQARGEGHRVDGRTDIFSLGVVFYELLSGRRPFPAGSREELLEQIATHEPRPPRQWDDTIPKELERICLKALAKRAAERYTTARDLADDLRHFAACGVALAPGAANATPQAASEQPVVTDTPTAPPSDGTALKVIPKGLRSFDAHDADFFLALLPGPRDREGLPDSIRFWKTRIEETDPDNTFAVGLIYGPSGCGKSSLVKAGLLPRLADNVIVVYVEATAQETEPRLLNGLRKRCPALPAHMGLKEALAALRRGQGIPAGKKVVIVLDQFEQWLHARKEEENTELVPALRQCDGGRVQCLVMVRDDFWLASTRFLIKLEVNLVQGKNAALADLFDLDHARKVLAAFGRAFGRLPEDPGETSREQREFLNQAVSGLAQEGRVICVRLALFAEMMKGKPWTPGTLRQVGGMAGVGVTFLEDAFASQTANPRHRLHQQAARGVLKALLPESGSDIKGHMRSHAELLGASGYASRPRDFDDLLRILDGELRLITPTEAETSEPAALARGNDEPLANAAGSEKEGYYQLTHDYLVHSLRDWLTRKQKETRRGRAELLLADRAAVWRARPENRQLPSLWQWCSIRGLTQKKNWTPPQRQMMRKATRYHALRGFVVAVLLALIGWGGYQGHGMLQAHALRERLLDANTNEVPTIVHDMAPYRRWLDPLLHDAQTQATQDNDRRKQLHTSLALLPVDPGQVDYLSGRLLDAAPAEVPVLREALAPHKEELVETLWAVVEQPAQGQAEQRLRAASALAGYDPDNPRWDQAGAAVVEELVAENPVYIGLWLEGFRPVKARLLGPLAAVFRDRREGRSAERAVATNLLADYAADQPDVLADLLMDADEKQFAVLYPKFKEQGERGLPVLTGEVDRQLPAEATEADKEKLAKRQANAAVALLRMDQPAKVWPLFVHRPDPRVRSYLIHRLAALGADPRAIVKRLEEEPDVSAQRALLLAVGEFTDKDYLAAERQAMLRQLFALYRDGPDAGLHGAAAWLLRQWGQKERLLETDHELATGKVEGDRRWYVNGQGQTFAVIPGPVEFVMGSPATEAGRGTNESLHRQRIGRTFAIATTAVTVEQFRWFNLQFDHDQMFRSPERDCPIIGVTWYEAAAYCNWLSRREGLPEREWCYVPNKDGQYAVGMQLAPDYLKRTGYRLPTEAEWEYACRADALTCRCYGQAEELLEKYAWYFLNSRERTWPVGSMKPNDLGLFDMHGNVYGWCQERYKPYPDKLTGDDIEDIIGVNIQDSRVSRGGSFINHASHLRSANRNRLAPTDRVYDVGLRPARTFR